MLFLNDEQEGEDTGSRWIVNRDATARFVLNLALCTADLRLVVPWLELALRGCYRRQESMSTDQPSWRLMRSCARRLWRRKEGLRFSLNHASCVVTDLFYWDDKRKPCESVLFYFAG